MSHTIRFSAFIIVVLTSFSLAFHAVFIKCDQESDLFSKFGTFQTSLLTMFGVALGEFGSVVESLEETEYDCPNSPSPKLAYYAGTVFLLAYLVVMAVVLLNLLIAVLSSEHQKVGKIAVLIEGEEIFISLMHSVKSTAYIRGEPFI